MSFAFNFWRFFQAKYSVGVVGVIINDDGEVLLVEHVFHPKKPWGLPGGWVGNKEDPAVTVQREIQEELSLDVEVGPILLLERPYSNHLDLAYRCYTHDTIGKLSFELLGYKWFDPTNLPPMMSVHKRAIQLALEMSGSK